MRIGFLLCCLWFVSATGYTAQRRSGVEELRSEQERAAVPALGQFQVQVPWVYVDYDARHRAMHALRTDNDTSTYLRLRQVSLPGTTVLHANATGTAESHAGVSFDDEETIRSSNVARIVAF